MDFQTKEEITFKVMSSNKAGEIINFITPKLITALKDFEGKQVLKQDSSLLKKIDDLINPILEETKNQFKDISILYIKTTSYDISVFIKLRFDNIDKNHFYYYDDYKYICSIENLKLKKFYDFEKIGFIDINEQLKTFDICLNLLEQFKTERAKLNPYCLTEMRDFKRI
jgi:hypothetical protein